MLIVCAMFRLGEPRPLRRPLGLSSPPYRYFLEQIGAGDLRPHRPQPSRRWFSAAGLDGNVCVVLVIVPFLGSISGAPALFGIARIRDERNSPHVIVPSGMWLEFGVARPPVT